MRVCYAMSPRLSDLYLRSQSDARLLSLARDGQDRAFAVLAERYRGDLYAQARRLSAAGNAEDLVQQTLLSAFAALRRGAEVGHCRGWLHAILRHAAMRAQMPFEAPLDAVAEAGVTSDTLLEARADAREVLLALDELPARQRKALIGSTMQGLSRAELADSLGVSEGAVRQLVHRARAALRAAVTAATPYQLLRWALGSGAGGASEVALGGGAAAGGFLAKIGMLAAAGAIAAGGAAATGHLPGLHGAARPARTVAASAGPALGRSGAADLDVRARGRLLVAGSDDDGPVSAGGRRSPGRNGVDGGGLRGGRHTVGAVGSRIGDGSRSAAGLGAAGSSSTNATPQPGSESRDGGNGGRGGFDHSGPGSGVTTTSAGAADSGHASSPSHSSDQGSGRQAVPASASDSGGGVSSTAAPTLSTVSAAPTRGSADGGSGSGPGGPGTDSSGSGSSGSGSTGSGRTGSGSAGTGPTGGLGDGAHTGAK